MQLPLQLRLLMGRGETGFLGRVSLWSVYSRVKTGSPNSRVGADWVHIENGLEWVGNWHKGCQQLPFHDPEKDRRRQLAAVVAAPPLQAPASSPPSPVADPGALPPDLLPHLLLGVISFSFPFSF